MKIRRHVHAPSARRRGFVLITVMWIAIALTGVVLVLGREVQVEHLTASQHLSQAKADAAEIGVEQYVMSVVEQEVLQPSYKDTIPWEQRELGDCYFWVITPKMTWGSGDTDESVYAYGITDEASKLDINYATEDMLELLPGLEGSPIAASIVDWHDADDNVTIGDVSGAQGEESDYYYATYGYRAKNANFENLDELRFVAGLTPVASDEPDASLYLWGADTNHNGVVDTNEMANSNVSLNAGSTTLRGLMPFITVWGFQATNPAPIPGGVAPTTASPYTDPNTGITQPPAQLTDITYQTPLDINSMATNTAARGLLQQLLQQYIPAKANAAMQQITTHFPQGGGGRGGGNTTGTPFTNIWQFIIAANLTSQDLTTATSDGTPLFNLLTCIQPAATAAQVTTAQNNGTAVPQTQFAKLNINSASEQALMAAGFTQADADAIINYRQTLLGQDPLQVPNISWILDVLQDPTVLAPAQSPFTGATPVTAADSPGTYITGQSTVFSAEIVTASKDGRAFKRVKVVVDDTSGSAIILYRRDLTDSGWPLDPALRKSISDAYSQGVPLNAISPPLTSAGIAGSPLIGQ